MFFFTKMQATGNDFIILDFIKQKSQYSLNILSKYLCNRNLSIGADGVIYLLESKNADYRMKIFNSDGTEAMMCGNGIRCLVKYINENYENKKEYKIETNSGIRIVNIDENEICVNMGKPILNVIQIPIYLPKIKNTLIQNEKIEIDNKEFNFYFLSVGNPHAVCFVENIEDISLEKYGPKIENFKFFPNRTNVEFVQVLSKNEIKIRVWERGVGETLSCGTGACASAYLSMINKNLNNEIIVHLKGGNLKIKLNENNEILLIGEVEKSFEGKINKL